MPRRRSRKTTRKKRRVTKPKISATVQVTPPKPSIFASASEPLRDKVEFSPNALAKCQRCRRKIKVGEQRFGITEYSERYNKDIYRYYHDRCCPASLKARVPDASDELNRQRKEEIQRTRLLEERNALIENLKTLRQIFARRMGYEPFLVFNTKTLEDIVVKMPTTQDALLNVHGIGPKKYQNFGDPIISLIKQYKRQVTEAAKRKNQDRRSRSSANNTSEVVVIGSDTEEEKVDNNGECVVGETLTCEELVNKKFEHAAANGYIISIDD